jgi:hypothetical protein
MSVHFLRPRLNKRPTIRPKLIKTRVPARIPVELTEEQWLLVRSALRARAASLATDPASSGSCRDMAVAHELIALQIARFKRER